MSKLNDIDKFIMSPKVKKVTKEVVTEIKKGAKAAKKWVGNEIDDAKRSSSKNKSGYSSSKKKNESGKNKEVGKTKGDSKIGKNGNQEAPSKITGYTKHGLNQIIGRDGGKGVALTALLDTVKNPTKVIEQANGAFKFVSDKAVVVLNATGKVVTAYAKSSKWWR